MAEMEKAFKKVSQLKEGGFILIEESVCRIKSIEKSKPGRHGAAKARIQAIGVFDGQKRNLLRPTSAEADIPIIEKGTAQVVAVMGDIVQIMDLKDYSTFDVKKPGDISGLKSGNEVEFMRYGDNALIVRKK